MYQFLQLRHFTLLFLIESHTDFRSYRHAFVQLDAVFWNPSKGGETEEGGDRGTTLTTSLLFDAWS